MKKQQLLNTLAKRAQTFKFEDAAKISNLNSQSLKVMLSRMEKEGLIERIEKGKYLIIPLGAEKGGYTLNEFVIGSQLIEPAVMAYWSALNYHGLTEQIPNTVFIQTISRKKIQRFESLGVKYRIVRVNTKKFFGIIQVWIEGTVVMITDPEKTIIDCLDKPHYCGGIIEASKALHSLHDDLDIDKLKKYAIDIGNSAVIKRLGCLCDKMGISIDIDPGVLSSNYPLLEPSLHRKGKINSKWRIHENTSDYIPGASE